MLERSIYFLISLLVFVACEKEQPTGIVHHYQLEKTTIETRFEKTNYHLPDLINVQINIEIPETYTTELSINKSYKEHFELESFQKVSTIGSLPNRLFTNYRYTFSALKPGDFYIPGFNVKATSHGKEFQIKTDSIQMNIAGLLDFTLANDSTDVLPIHENVPVSNSSTKWWLITLILIAIAYIVWKKIIFKEPIQPKAPKGVKDYFAELKSLPGRNLNAEEFDTRVNQLYHLINQFNRTTKPKIEIQTQQWKSFYTKQSFAMNDNESVRQEKLVKYIIHHCSKDIDVK